MNDTPAPDRITVEPGILRDLAAAAGLSLTDDRTTALLPQAEPHFALLRELDSVADSSSEPAAEFHLPQQSSAGSA
jgi:hypothetical protein